MKQGLKFKVTIQEKGDEHELLIDKDTFVIGRAQSADVVLDNDLISRRQLSITVKKNQVWIEEMGSSNGTWVNGRKLSLHEKVQIGSHDKVALGSKQGPFVFIDRVADEEELHEEDEFQETDRTRDNIRMETVREVGGREVEAVPLPPKFRHRPVQESAEKIVHIKTEAEKGLFEQIKRMVGKEAETVRMQALEEARNIKSRAEEEARDAIKLARAEATQRLKDAERAISDKKTFMESQDKEFQAKMNLAKRDHQELLDTIKDLEDKETQQQKNLQHLSETIAREEERMSRERRDLDKLVDKYEKDREAFEAKYEEFVFEERRTKARIETELVEAKLKASQIMAEADKALTMKNGLEPEIKQLKIEKENFERELREVTYNREMQQREFERLTRDCDLASKSLAEIKSLQESTTVDIQKKREEIQQKFDDLQLRTQEVEDLVRNSTLELEAIQNRKRDLVKEIEHERSNALKDVLEEAEKQKNKERIEIEKLKEKKKFVIGEIEKIVADTKLNNEKLVEEAMGQGLEIKETARLEGEAMKQQAMQEAANVKKQADAYFQDAKVNARNMIEKADASVKKMQEDGLRQAQKLEEQKQSVLAEIEQLNGARAKHTAETEVKIKKMMDEAALAVQAIQQKGEQDFKEQKAKQETKLAELKHVEMISIKDLRNKAEEDIRQHKIEKAKEVGTNVFALVTSEMIKQKNKVMDDVFIEAVTKEIKSMVTDTLLDKVGADSNRLQEILKTSENARGKETIFWKRAMIGGVASAFVILLLIAFPGIISGPVGLIAGIFEEDKGPNNSDVFLEKVKEARVKAIYNPETTEEFKDSYVDNVLFTTNFVAKLQDKAFQDKWILELNDYFIRDLDVKDTTIIKFVSLETNLIKDLQKIKSEAESKNPEPSIEAMRNREIEFRQKLTQLFVDPEKVSRFYAYSKRFWNGYYKARKPATAAN